MEHLKKYNILANMLTSFLAGENCEIICIFVHILFERDETYAIFINNESTEHLYNIFITIVIKFICVYETSKFPFIWENT